MQFLEFRDSLLLLLLVALVLVFGRDSCLSTTYFEFKLIITGDLFSFFDELDRLFLLFYIDFTRRLGVRDLDDFKLR